MSSSSPQKRLRRFVREPEKLAWRELTPRSSSIIHRLAHYQFLSSSLIVALTPGDPRQTYKHLQTLFHRGLVNRFTFPRFGGSGEFIYYLDNPQSLQLLSAEELATAGELVFDFVERNREKNYAGVHSDPDTQGKLLFLHHELMLSRFHAQLEISCGKSKGLIELAQWQQGPALWHQVEVPKTVKHPGVDAWQELGTTERLPHRPDAFFTLRFLTKPADEQDVHFFYEADRGTENTTRFIKKLRAHFHYIVKQKLHQQHYGVKVIRAVLVETEKANWADRLREAAKHPMVSGGTPSSLFWFTPGEKFFTARTEVVQGGRTRLVPLYLTKPELVFQKVWASPVEDKLVSLLM